MYKVEGFLFETKELARTAQKEAEGIRYIKAQTHMDSPEAVLGLYNRLILKEVFVTPVGFAFLGELQDFLRKVPTIGQEEILPIPVFHPETAGVSADENDASRQREYEKRRAQAERDLRENRKEAIRRNRVNARERERAARLEENAAKYAAGNYRKPFLVSTFFAVVFALGLVGMFLITVLSTDNVNIINYENEVIDRYEVWEEELTKREAAIREREEELGLPEDADREADTEAEPDAGAW